MNYKVVEIDQCYNDKLIELTKFVNTGSDLFQVDRSPNFFALSEELGETRQYGLFKGEQLIGNVAVSKQSRIVAGVPSDVYYLNDLRIHPDYQRTRAYYRLMDPVFKTYQSSGNVFWMFSTILDSNSHKAEIIRGSKGIPSGTKIGTTVHLGIPMFGRQIKRKETVIEISGEEAWKFYHKYAKMQEFAPYDRNLFLRENGLFLAIKENKEIKAVCKLIDQSMSRTLRMSTKLPYYSKLVNLLCKIKGCPLLPSVGRVFDHGYLSFYVTKDSDYRIDFLSHIQEHHYKRFTYMFTGLSGEEAADWKKSIFHQALTSTTFVYGDCPSGLEVRFHELTLI
jgi:hypothetical protein